MRPAIAPLLAVSCVLLTAACSGESGAPEVQSEESDTTQTAVCASHHAGKTDDGDAVAVCDKTFATRPFVRPSADKIKASGSSTVYAALTSGFGGMFFVARDGTEYLALGSDKKPLAESKLPSAVRMPSNRSLFLIYKVTGTIGTFTDPGTKEASPSITVTAAVPAVLLEGDAIDGALLGAWEGTVSKRVDDSSFDDAVRVPIRISFGSLSPLSNFNVWSSSKTLPDGKRSAMIGTVENFSSAVKASDGKCFASLASLGSKDPFLGASSPAVKLYRVAGMHTPGDQVIVLDYPSGTKGLSANGMDGLRILHPGGLLLKSPGDDWDSISIRPHGTPNGNRVELRPVKGGGGGC
jgi:hypothetical protein